MRALCIALDRASVPWPRHLAEALGPGRPMMVACGHHRRGRERGRGRKIDPIQTSTQNNFPLKGAWKRIPGTSLAFCRRPPTPVVVCLHSDLGQHLRNPIGKIFFLPGAIFGWLRLSTLRAKSLNWIPLYISALQYNQGSRCKQSQLTSTRFSWIPSSFCFTTSIFQRHSATGDAAIDHDPAAHSIEACLEACSSTCVPGIGDADGEDR